MTDKRRMSRPEAVCLLMQMMKKAQNEFEVEALALACRTILKRHKDSKKNLAFRHSINLTEKLEEVPE